MNKKKYEGYEHPVREVTDLKDLVLSSCKMFADVPAYLIKNKKTGEFEELTYEESGKDMNALGTKFMDMGLKDKKIAVIGETSYEWFITYQATVCGTGVIVPLDKKLPADELASLIERSGANALVYSPKVKKSLKNILNKKNNLEFIISMDKESSDEGVLNLPDLIEDGKRLLEEGNDAFTSREIDPDQMASIIFTSGTTGKAKGVMLSHRNIVSNVINMSRRMNLKEGWVILSILPVHHTLENTCVDWTTFYQGRTLAICEGVRYILDDMNAVKANLIVGVPLLFEKLFKGMMKQARARGEEEKIRNAIQLSRRLQLFNNRLLMTRLFKPVHQAFGGHMMMFITGGAAIDPDVIRSFEAMGIPMIQGYGLTESSPIVTVNLDICSKADSAGKPMYGTELRIDNPDKDGIGEIVCKSDSVMMGYYENPEATAEVLKDGWLYTGDLGYLDDEGYLYLTGRKKTVIVTKGGKNIFPEEIEDVIKENDLVEECLVHGVTDKKVGNVIVTADIYPNYKLLEEEKGKMTDSDIYHFYRKVVDEANDKMPAYKTVKRVNIRKTPFNMTTTGKIKRYGNFIEGEDNSGSPAYLKAKEEEKQQAEAFMRSIKESSDPFIKYRDGRPITDIKMMLEESVSKYPERPAFHFRKTEDLPYQHITYRQMMADVNGMGTALIANGLKGSHVALVGDMTYPWVISYLALMGGAGVAVPLDQNLEPDILKEMIKKADVKTVIFSEKFRQVFREMYLDEDMELETLISFDALEENDGVMSLDELVLTGKDMVSRGDRQFLDAEVYGDEMASIFFTPGTTGSAKSVMLSNRNICENIMGVTAVHRVTERDIFLSSMSAHKAYECTCNILLPLYKGASVALSSEGRALLRDMRELKPTYFITEPEVLEKLYMEIWDRALRNADHEKLIRAVWTYSNLGNIGKFIASRTIDPIKMIFGGRMRMIISGGSTIDSDILDFFNDIGIPAVQGYGLTECSPVVAINPDKGEDMRNESVGHVLPGVSIKIEGSREGKGEILVKGGNVMLGYYGDEDTTKAAMEGGWFRTGDIGYIDDEDFIYITGKKYEKGYRRGTPVEEV
jgi:long-subunit acyl-CoA synthetase (AMP-forming)